MTKSKMAKSISTYFLFTALLIPLLLVGSYVLYQRTAQKLPVLGPYSAERANAQLQKTPDWVFTDQNNTQFSSDSLANKIQVFNFFFTSCPTICPAMNKNVQTAQQVFIDDENIQFVSVSVDPERDTPERLKQYEKNYSLNEGQWHFLTGDKKEIYLMARKGYNLSATDADAGGANDIIHSQQVLLIDTNQQIRGIYNGVEREEMARMIKDISKLKRELKL